MPRDARLTAGGGRLGLATCRAALAALVSASDVTAGRMAVAEVQRAVEGHALRIVGRVRAADAAAKDRVRPRPRHEPATDHRGRGAEKHPGPSHARPSTRWPWPGARG